MRRTVGILLASSASAHPPAAASSLLPISSRRVADSLAGRRPRAAQTVASCKHEAASAYVEAANCYKKFSPQEAAQALDQAVNLFLEIGRLNMAARYSKDIGEIYQQEQDLEKASHYLDMLYFNLLQTLTFT
ncbi:hypothetical protein GUJ93_ZPchr0008g13900 [Zizania palustris]|uniref:Uncharacterized protein n=1 Tax=Zizania palustris TaxID=103762 RepID=A0A8J5RYH4_ZIZPA|nr:hypothetical protein GUJ93_ZPchr0008g13900 [Zizania palustris]